MSDVTYSMRISQETKDLLQKLQQESGATQSEFFRIVAGQLELDQLKQEGISGEEIDELQMHTARINEIMIAIIERSSSLKGMYDQQISDIREELNEKIKLQSAIIENLTNTKKSLEEEHGLNQIRIQDLENQLTETKKALGQANDLITEYKKNISDLTVKAGEYQQKAGEYDVLSSKCNDLEKGLEIKENALAQAELRVQDIEQQLANARESLTAASAAANEYKIKYEQCESDMKTSLREAAADTREEIAKIKEEYLEKLQSYIKENNHLRQELTDAYKPQKEEDKK